MNRPAQKSGASRPKSLLIRGTADGWIFLALALALFLLPMARGGNRLWAVSVFEAWIFLLAAAWAIGYAVGRFQLPRDISRLWWPLAIWLLWLLYILLQTIPLPVQLLSEISPQAAGLYGNADQWAGQGPQQAPVSIAVGVTRAHLLESAAYFCLFTLVVVLVRGSARLRFLALVLVCGGLFQALYGSLFLLSGAQEGLFGDTASRLNAATGTFVNRNHLAGYLEITGAVGIGLVLSRLDQTVATSWRTRLRHLTEFMMSDTIRVRFFVAIMFVALVLTRSRAGNVGFVVSLSIAGLIYVLIRERRLFLKSLLVFATFFVVDLLILGNLFGIDQVVERLESTDLQAEQRVSIWPALVAVAQSYWPVGSGLGTFHSAFPQFRVEGIGSLYFHAHNDYMQFLIETGIVGVTLLFLLVSWMVLHCLGILLKRRDRLAGGIAFAGLMSIIAIAIHSVVDFNLQIPANAATLVAVLGMVASCSTVGRRSRRAKAVGQADTNKEQ